VTGRLTSFLLDDPPAIDRAPIPTFNPLSGGSEAMDLLNLIAWCVSAAGVGGLLIVGIQMAIQMNRGTPGEEADHFRGLVMVALACVVGATAGPVVQIFGDLGLTGP
jgi:hypothetical protein